MVLAGLSFGLLHPPQGLIAMAEKAARGAERVMAEYGDAIEQFARRGFTRACFLGSETRHGCMHEGRLKMQEMTAGLVASTLTCCAS